MKKKWMAVVLALALSLGMAACAGAPAGGSGDGASTGFMEDAISDAAGNSESSGDTIKVGLLAAESGSTAVLDSHYKNATEMAVKEINDAGGVNGKMIEIIQEDYASDPSTAAEKAEKLIVNDKVVAIVGVVLSSCRQAVLPVVEKYDNLLIYPTDYEGLEQSDNIVYVGCVPNQQIQTITPWLTENLGKSVYVIGNDYLYPRSTLAQMKTLLAENGGTVVGEEYIAMDETDYSATISKILAAKPDVVFSVLVGDGITAFQKQYAQYSNQEIKMFHLCLDESGVAAIGVENCLGVYSGQTYFSTVQTEENKVFASKYQELYNTVPTVYASSAYVSNYLLANALKTLDDGFTTADLTAALRGSTFKGPAGLVTVKDNNHCTVTPRIGQVNSEGLFDVVYESESPMDPDPFAGDASAS